MPDERLVIEIEVPDDVSDDEIVEAVTDLALAANDYHRSLGGSGLAVESVEITCDPDED